MDYARRRTQQLFYGGIIASLALLWGGWWSGSVHELAVPGGRLVMWSRLFGLLATYCILLEVLLMSRAPFIERHFDLHETIDLHRLTGYGILFSVVAHVVFVTLGYAAPGHVGLWHQFVMFNTQFEDIFIATLGTLLFFVATALSVQVARKRLPHEWWWLMHLSLYGAILFVTLHQVKTGGDFLGHFWFTAYWYAWYIGVFGLLAYYRFCRPLLSSLRHRFRVERVTQEARGVYSVYISGRHVEDFQFQPGQYATWWLLAPGMWWQGHPFSFSGPAGQRLLRFTAKVSGDFSGRLDSLRPGTPVIIDGPRGGFTASRAARASNVLLVAGGIGVAPYVPIIWELLAAGKTVTLLYAARTPQDVAFASELRVLEQRGLRVQTFMSEQGQYITDGVLAPYIQPGTVAYICGPDGMSRALAGGLNRLGLPKRAIVTERFAY